MARKEHDEDYEVDVTISFSSQDLRERFLADIRGPEDAFRFVDALMRQAHNDASRRNDGNFPGWHYEMLEGCVGIVSDEEPHETIRVH